MSLLPPTNVSPNGQEIWDWAGRLSEHTQLLHRRRELYEQIREAKPTCGSCTKWMTRACPAERHSNTTGRNTGPSCRTIKCAQFDMNSSAAKLVATGEAALLEVNAKLKGATP